MGLFGKRDRKKLDTAEQQTRNTVQQPEELADVLYVYLQKEGFFPSGEQPRTLMPIGSIFISSSRDSMSRWKFRRMIISGS